MPFLGVFYKLKIQFFKCIGFRYATIFPAIYERIRLKIVLPIVMMNSRDFNALRWFVFFFEQNDRNLRRSANVSFLISVCWPPTKPQIQKERQENPHNDTDKINRSPNYHLQGNVFSRPHKLAVLFFKEEELVRAGY